MDDNNTNSQNTVIFFPRDLVDMLKSSGSCVGLQEPEKRSSYNHKEVLVKRNVQSPCNTQPSTPARSSAHISIMVKVSVLVPRSYLCQQPREDYHLRPAGQSPSCTELCHGVNSDHYIPG